MRSSVLSALAAVALVAGAASVASAASGENLRRATPAEAARYGFEPGAEVFIAEAPSEPAAFFGSQQAMARFAGTQFQPRISTLAYGTSTGATEMVYLSGDTFADAHIDLPSGAILDEVRWWAIDSAAADVGFAGIRSCLPASGSGNNINTVFNGTGTTGTTGPQTGTFLLPSVVVDNNTCDYFIRVIFTAANQVLQQIRVAWRRQVSAAPAVATFNDVPTGHFAFRFVEALAASGVTGGCGAGTYCPDSPVTRAQMAIFLATALGLHFPN